MDPLERFLDSLKQWGILRTAAVERALRALEWDDLLEPHPGGHGHFLAPFARPDGTFEPSARLSVLLAELLEVQAGTRVVLPHPRPRVLTALLSELGATLVDPVRTEPAERGVDLMPAGPTLRIAENGFALRLNVEPHAETLVKRVVTPDGPADMGLDDVHLEPAEGPARPIRHLLVLEGFTRRALNGRPRTRQDQLFVDGVDTIWDPNPQFLPGLGTDRLDWARRWFLLGYIHQASASLHDAVALYEASLDAHPTAEAHTFLGWTLAMLGDIKQAIRQCENAIDVDPTLGNPYNDIGAYLIELEHPDLALPWFERALACPRYEAPHFAHTNAGRALLAMGRRDEARIAFENAVEIAPAYKPARDYLSRLSDSGRGPAV